MLLPRGVQGPVIVHEHDIDGVFLVFQGLLEGARGVFPDIAGDVPVKILFVPFENSAHDEAVAARLWEVSEKLTEVHYQSLD